MYFEAFPRLKQFFQEQADTCISRGYIETNPVTKRRIYFAEGRDFERLRKQLCYMGGESYSSDFLGLSSKFWKFWSSHKHADSDFFNEVLKPKFSQYISIYSSMKNTSLNYPIQSSAADVTKLALIFMYEYILTNNLMNIVKVVNIIHDEIVLECSESIAESIALKLIECMRRAGTYFSSITMEAEYKIGNSWKH